jgi:predicted metal-dependent hydrolase
MLSTEIIELKTLGEAVNVELRRSLKAKNISIRIKGKKVELVLPYKAPEKLGCNFLLRKEKWIREKLKNRKEGPKKHAIHNEYSILNNVYKLKHINTKSKFSASIEDQYIVAHSSNENLFEALTDFFKHKALLETTALAKYLSEIHEFQYNKISVKELKSKWGSCSSLKNLVFNWRIIFAPRSVFHYLVTHEICHLKEMNHSTRFWKLVASISPEYKEAKRWFREHGHTLHHYLPIEQT